MTSSRKRVKKKYKKVTCPLFLKILLGNNPNKNSILIAFPAYLPDEILYFYAAQDISTFMEYYSEIIALKSLKGDILLRILKNTQTQEFTLYLISEDERLYKYCLVKIQGIDREFLTDSKGKIFFGKFPELENRQLSFKIAPPITSFDNLRREDSGIIKSFSRFRSKKPYEIKFHFSEENGKQSLHLNLLTSNENKFRKVAFIPDRGEVLISIPIRDLITFEGALFQDSFSLYIYE